MSVKTLQALVGIFFLLLGFMGVLPNVDEGVFAISNRHFYVELVFGIVELICGAVLLLSLLTLTRRKTIHQASMLIFFFWIAQIILSKIVWGPPHYTLASFLNWSLVLSVELIVAASVWMLASTYRR
ncbi:MAG TPA: hypothetical protein VF857_02500 [Spirochaetota bacterium]